MVIGFSQQVVRSEKRLFDYPDLNGEAVLQMVKHINPYLVEATDIILDRRHTPLCAVPEMLFGNMPADGGFLLMTEEEKNELLEVEPEAKNFIRPLLDARSFINGSQRWCLWLEGVEPNELRSLPRVYSRVQSVRETRLQSARPHLADVPHLFAQITYSPTEPYLIVPSASSERRAYIPIGFVETEVISNNLNLVVPNATVFHFGVLSSAMHMAWVRYVAGRLKSDYRYSKDIVYNNYPWPSTTDNQRRKIEECAQAVINARAAHAESSLADLYDPSVMPKDLRKAHNDLDRAVDASYGRTTFNSERERVEMLFEKYQELTNRNTNAENFLQ